MLVTDAMKASYNDFVKSQAESLGAFAFERSAILWHYTNGAGLLGILESGQIHATQVACVNDSTEVLFAQRVFWTAIERLCEEKRDDEASQTFLRNILKEWKEMDGQPSHAASEFFVACFSELRDDLNQWLKYGGSCGENGYALGFRADGLFGCAYTLVVKVCYDPSIQEQVAKTIAEATLQFHNDGAEALNETERVQWANDFFGAWDPAIYQLAPLAKDNCFSSEREYRMVHQLNISEYSQIRVTQKSNLLSRYIPLVPKISASGQPKLPLVEVVVGPGRHQKITQISVGTLLKQLGYESVPVSISSLPLQRA